MSTKAKERRGEGRREKGDRKGGNKVDGVQQMASPSVGSTEKGFFRSECSWGLLGYILARGMDEWRRGASIRDYRNGNVELPQRATSSLTR